MSRILIAGPPRSGTTWIAQTLARSEGAVYVHEPDGAWEPFALRAGLGLPTQPVLDPGDRAERLEALWAGVFAGGARRTGPLDRLSKYCLDSSSWAQRMAARRGDATTVRLRVALATARPLGARAAEHVVAKTVNACCCLPWIVNGSGAQVIVVRRFPLNVLGSWKELGHGGDPVELRHLAEVARERFDVDLEPETLTPLERQAFSLGVLGGALHRAASDHPAWVVARHDDLCLDPAPRFEALAASVGLTLSAESLRFLADSDRDGSGYHTQRPTAAVPHRWREQFDTAEIDAVRAVLDRFPASAGWHGWFDAAP